MHLKPQDALALVYNSALYYLKEVDSTRCTEGLQKKLTKVGGVL